MTLNSPFPIIQEDSDEDKLVRAIDKLSPEARQRVLDRIGAEDMSKYRGAVIKIYDWGENEAKPRAAYVFPNGTKDSIDIFEVLKANPLNISDPRILGAIRRWLQLSRYSAVLPKVYRNPPMNFGRIASANLKKVGDAFKVERVSANLREEVMLAVIPDTHELLSILRFAWECLYRDEIQYVSYGENDDCKESKRKRNNSEKLKRLREVFNEVGLGDSPAVRLQIDSLEEDYLRDLLHYIATQMTQVLVKIHNVQTSIRVDVYISFEGAAGWSILLPPDGGEQQWVVVQELFKKCGIPESDKERHSLRNLITGAGHSLPSFKLPEPERKLAALVGMSEPFWREWEQSADAIDQYYRLIVSAVPSASPSQQPPDDATHYVRELAFIDNKRMSLDDAPPHVTKSKLDWIIDFLNDSDGDLLSRRPTWKTMRRRFLDWFFDTKKDAAKKSRERARDINIERGLILPDASSDGPLDRRYYPPPWLDPTFLLPDVLNEYSFFEILVELPFFKTPVKS
jgi:hypothetical protein